MATVILTAVGTMLGGPIGAALGAFAGQKIDSMIFGHKGREGPRLSELKVTTSSYGMAIPRQFGRMRVSGQIIWSTDLVEHKDRQGSSKSGTATTNYTYSASFAVALSSRPVLSVGRIWADGKLLRGEAGDLKTAGTFRLHAGHGDQAPDPLIAAAEGAGQCPAYRGLAYAVFEDLQLADYGNRIPSLSFEVIADTEPLELGQLLDGVIADHSALVPLPGIAGLSNEGPLAETLASLEPFYPVDCDACDEQLVLRPDLRETPAQVLPEAATSSNVDDFGGKDGYSRKRGGESEAPIAVLRYYDVDRDYQPGAQRATGRPLPGQPRTIDLPAALDAASARQAVERAAKRIGSSLEASPLVYVSDKATFATLFDIDLAEVCITSNAMVTDEDAPAGAFTLSDVPGVAVVVEKAVGTKCARSWKILPTVGDDPEFPDVSPRDAQALREWKVLSA